MEISSLTGVYSFSSIPIRPQPQSGATVPGKQTSNNHLTSGPGSAAQPTRPTRPQQPARVAAQDPPINPVLEKLKARDREVRAHEQAHLARAGGLAKGGVTLTYQKGPDGRLYAIGGSVQIDSSPVPGDPEATIQKARRIRAAALAPATPSAQDRAVAATASRMEAQARLEALQLRQQGAAIRRETPTAESGLADNLDVFA